MKRIANLYLKRFFKDKSGNFAIAFSIAVAPAMGVTGAAVDYSRANAVSSQLQAAMDSAVLAGMSVSARDKKLGTDQTVVARTTFNADPAASGIM